MSYKILSRNTQTLYEKKLKTTLWKSEGTFMHCQSTASWVCGHLSNLLPCSERRWCFSREVIKDPGDAKLVTLQSHQDLWSGEVSSQLKIHPNRSSVSYLLTRWPVHNLLHRRARSTENTMFIPVFIVFCWKKKTIFASLHV